VRSKVNTIGSKNTASGVNALEANTTGVPTPLMVLTRSSKTHRQQQYRRGNLALQNNTTGQ